MSASFKEIGRLYVVVFYQRIFEDSFMNVKHL